MPISTINSKSIADGTVVASDILDGTISSSKLVSANIAGDRIAANTLSNTVFQTGSVESYMRANTLDFGMRNRIINGAMRIDQRNAGASVTNESSGVQYTVDRWQIYGDQAAKFTVQQNAGSVTPPVGFTNYAGITSLSSYSVGSGETFLFRQKIEGFNTADLGFGTASARPVTISFWVRSSLTGTFGAFLINNGFNRSYPFGYTITSANTWEQKFITIPGDTSGTWATTTAVGIQLGFSLGSGSTFSNTQNWAAGAFYQPSGATSVVGTNGATWYITGVQLEEGSQATPFEYRQHGTELALCQRYYQSYYLRSLYVNGSSYIAGAYPSVVFMRAAPTVTFTDIAGNASRVTIGGTDNYAIAAGGISGAISNLQTLALVDAIITSPPASSTWWAVNAKLSIEL
jgi:hypothetical protein